MNAAAFEAELARRIDDAFRLNPGVGDHRPRHPWLTSSLGDPFSGVWFVAENPSLSQVQRARDPGGGPPTTEAQWLVSRGDRLFRQALVEHGFKDGPWDRRGGWRCYVTNLIKEADYAEAWKLRRERDHLRAAEAWAPVLRWQLDASRPRLVVLMGGRVDRLVDYLRAAALIALPQTMRIAHYSYVAMRPAGRLGPMHPDRVAAYLSSFADVRRRFDEG
ncbi:hypothetical protein GCM10011504_51780 [Siccirubricoccus deserti]|uniref:Uracil-DNA glycosylase-like domain-containing protein n=1 Tax=Siccirubricoccus deserti TaxID=2013562 RepID=A0A9X0R2Y4_9PROT|nr:uracil-DNA glycosylase family protein [Siccirubricoccus deserti]MBC4018650.1 hypothetical protein [Siccirubricoccus deserti]GGC67468.1 hypothetical protein GCM10011504_51780 [Siccirubricoccus deserti]